MAYPARSQSMASKKTLVLVHGYLGGSAQWADQRDAFSKTFNVITPDLPGFGLNHALDAPDSINAFATYVLNEIDQRGVESFHLLGHSMGGMIVQEIVRLAPLRVDTLVLYGTGPLGNMPGRFETLEASRQRLQQEGVEETARRISATWFAEGKASGAYASCVAIALMTKTQSALAALTAMEYWSGTEVLSQITAPTLILWGDQDQSYQWPLPEQLWREIPGAGLSVVAGCSHAVHLEKPALFNAILDDFLNSKAIRCH